LASLAFRVAGHELAPGWDRPVLRAVLASWWAAALAAAALWIPSLGRRGRFAAPIRALAARAASTACLILVLVRDELAPGRGRPVLRVALIWRRRPRWAVVARASAALRVPLLGPQRRGTAPIRALAAVTAAAAGLLLEVMRDELAPGRDRPVLRAVLARRRGCWAAARASTTLRVPLLRLQRRGAAPVGALAARTAATASRAPVLARNPLAPSRDQPILTATLGRRLRCRLRSAWPAGTAGDALEHLGHESAPRGQVLHGRAAAQ